MRLLIVGFDPGENVGLALIDTFGRIVLLTSKTSTNVAHISQIILKYGKPIIVATDRRPLPKNVEKLAKSLGAKIYMPMETLSVKEKNDLVKKYDIKVKNNHERDAVTAALKAYKHYVSLFKKVNLSLNSLGLNNIYGKVIESLIFGYAENLDEAINKALAVKEHVYEKKVAKPIVVQTQKDVKRLEKDIEILREYNKKLLEEIKKLKGKRPKVKIVIPQNELNLANQTIELLKKLRRLEIQGKIPIIEVSLENVEDVDKRIDLTERVVFTEEKSLEFLNKYNIKACVAKKEIDRSKLNFSVISLDEKDMKYEEGVRYVEKDLLEEKIKEARKIGLIEWAREYKKRKF